MQHTILVYRPHGHYPITVFDLAGIDIATFLLPCAWLTHRVEPSYCAVFPMVEPTWRTIKVY